MSAHFPDHETIYTALSLATRAPSVHNTQPWRFRVEQPAFELYSDPRRWIRLDPKSREMLISCGADLA